MIKLIGLVLTLKLLSCDVFSLVLRLLASTKSLAVLNRGLLTLEPKRTFAFDFRPKFPEFLA